MSYELQKDLYFFEWDRRYQLYNAIRLPQAVMLGVGGALLYVLHDIYIYLQLSSFKELLCDYPWRSFFLTIVIFFYFIDAAYLQSGWQTCCSVPNLHRLAELS
jgi:hypothetical protein